MRKSKIAAKTQESATKAEAENFTLCNATADELAQEVLRRLLTRGEADDMNDALSTYVAPRYLPESELVVSYVTEHNLSPDDIWPGEYVEIDDASRYYALFRLVAAAAYDFDMGALAELRHMLALAGVYSHHTLCADALQPDLLP